MRKQLMLYVFVFISTLFFPLTSFAWNEVGHRLVAKIAYDNLTPDVRAKVDKIVTDFSKDYPYIHSFVDLAPWPDQLYAQQIMIYEHWHYIDVGFSDDGTPLKDITDTDNAVWALKQIQVVVHNAKANPSERARFLAFMIHIVGDLHQPLHTVSRITATKPNGDRGGNLFEVSWGHVNDLKATKLHHIWDMGLGEFDVTPSVNQIDSIANRITSYYPSQSLGPDVGDLSFQDWTTEGGRIATSFIYSTKQGEVPTDKYIANGKQLCEQRVALAGYRLAAMLNKLLA